MPKIPNAILQELKCKHCRRWLSCGPVHVLPQGESLCGRCERIAIRQYRHTAFEALAGYFHYPCSNYSRHCPQVLLWNDALEHEEDCSYETFCGTLCSHPSVIFKKERKLDESEDVRCEYVPETILDYLRCSACGNHLSCPPVYVKPDGRSVCHRCATSNGPPPDSVRHYAFECLADATIFPCIYRGRGCTQHFKFGPDMWNHELECSYGNLRSSSVGSGRGAKERGVIATHTGHVYGTITPNALHLFAPQNQNVKRTTVNGQVELKRSPKEEDKFVKALKKQQQKFSKSEVDEDEENVDSRQSINSQTPSSTKSESVFNFSPHSLPRIDPQTLNGVKRNESVYSNSSSLVNEIKALKEKKKIAESPTDDPLRDELKLVTNLDDIFWVYDDVLTEYKNRQNMKNGLVKAI